MKKLLLLLLLSFLSTQSLAKVGDFYTCEMKKHLHIGANYDYEGDLDTFIFEKKKDKIIFRNFFYASSFPIIENEAYDQGAYYGTDEVFAGGLAEYRFYYYFGDFSFTLGAGTGAIIVLAKCKII